MGEVTVQLRKVYFNMLNVLRIKRILCSFADFKPDTWQPSALIRLKLTKKLHVF